MKPEIYVGRTKIQLSAVKRIRAKRAFQQGESCRQISEITGVSQRVWERELREALGDADFEHQLELNKQSGKRKPREDRPPTTRRATVDSRHKGQTVPVVCVETEEAFGSIGKAASAMGLNYHQVRHSVFGGGRAFRPDGHTLQFRRWKKGDQEVEVRPIRKGIPLRFADGRCWPSVHALAKEMGAPPSDITKFCRRLKQLGYGPGSEPIAPVELRILARLMPMLDRQKLEDRISAFELTVNQ